MNKSTYRKNYNELLKKTTQMLRAYREQALKSGAFDLEEETATFSLPKNVMCAALEHCKDQWGPNHNNSSPYTRSAKKQIKQIHLRTYL